MANELAVFRAELNQQKGEIAAALPANTISADKLARSVLTSVNVNKGLLRCDRHSLLASVMSAATLGLECNSPVGHGYLVPFKGKVQFLPGYGGYITMVDNSDISLYGEVVYEGDEFDYEYGTSPYLKHRPAKASTRPSHAYAIAQSYRVPPRILVMGMDEIIALRNKSAGYQYAIGKGKTNSPWQTDFPAMARKSPIRSMGKSLPLRVQKAAALEAAHDRGRMAYINRDDQVIEVDSRDVTPDTY